MIRRALETMAQEPWCWHPEAIATLTDWQLECLYLEPAERRARAFETNRPAGPTPVPPAADPAPVDLDSAALKTYVINQFIASGMSLQDALSMYEAQRHLPVDG